MRRDRLNLQGGMALETGLDINGRFFIAYARSASVWIRCQRERHQGPPDRHSPHRCLLAPWRCRHAARHFRAN